MSANIKQSVLDLVGKTPLLMLQKLSQSCLATVYVKCEMLNPSGSVKDRAALAMIEAAETEGLIDKEEEPVEVEDADQNKEEEPEEKKDVAVNKLFDILRKGGKKDGGSGKIGETVSEDDIIGDGGVVDDTSSDVVAINKHVSTHRWFQLDQVTWSSVLSNTVDNTQ